jgi:hypothetical protein
MNSQLAQASACANISTNPLHNIGSASCENKDKPFLKGFVFFAKSSIFMTKDRFLTCLFQFKTIV